MKKQTIIASTLLMTTGFAGHAFADNIQTSTSSTTSETSIPANSNLVLKARIDGNYKVVGDFTPVTSKKPTLYKVTVSYTDGTKDYIFTIGAGNNSFIDWHAKQNMVNTYTIRAVFEDGTSIASNSVKVVMGANGEVTTEDAFTSGQTVTTGASTKPVPKTEEERIAQEKADKLGQMKRDHDAGKQGVSINSGARTEVKKSLLSEKTQETLNRQLDNIPAEKRDKVLNRVISKIDTLVAKFRETVSAKNERTVNLLLEVKSIIQEKLAAAGDDSLIQDILTP